MGKYHYKPFLKKREDKIWYYREEANPRLSYRAIARRLSSQGDRITETRIWQIYKEIKEARQMKNEQVSKRPKRDNATDNPPQEIKR